MYRLATTARTAIVFALITLVGGNVAWGEIGSGALYVAGASSTPTHWNIPTGVATTAEIRDIDPAELGGSLPATLLVIVKSSVIGNTTLTATRIDLTDDYTFTYTPPSTGEGDPFDACGTTIVAYTVNGLNSNNDYADDGINNGSRYAASGFRFLDANGDPIDCQTVGVETVPWGGLKRLYR